MVQASVSSTSSAGAFRYFNGSNPVSSEKEYHGNWSMMASGSVLRFLVTSFARQRDAMLIRVVVNSIVFRFRLRWWVS